MPLSKTTIADIRKRALGDLWFFTRYIIGYTDIDNPLHREMCRTAQSWERELMTLTLVPRGHLKTSCLTIGHDAWKIARNPNVRIALFTAVHANGIRILRELRGQFERNPRMRAVFPELCPPPDAKRLPGMRWTDYAFEVPARTRSGESTFTLVGVESSAVSQHFDDLDYDDMLDATHVSTEEQRNKHFEWFLNSLQLRHSPAESRARIKGTRWHYNDTYGRLLKRNEEAIRKTGRRSLRVYRRSAIENGMPIWPARFSLETLEQLRADLGDYIYSCQYLNDPVPESSAVLKWRLVKFVDAADIPKNTINFASVLLRTGDIEGPYDVIVIGSIDVDGNLYIRNICLSTLAPDALLRNLSYFRTRYNLRHIYIDERILTNILSPALASNRRYATLPFISVTRASTTHISRVLSIEPAVTNGHFHIQNGIDSVLNLREEFDQMSSAGSKGADVILTCLADFAHHAGRPSSEASEWPYPGSYDAAFGPLLTRAQAELSVDPIDRLLAAT